MVRIAKKDIFQLILFIILAVLGTTLPLFADSVPVPTPTNVDFYGDIPGGKVGDEVTAYDPDGVICGKMIIRANGQYGLLHVYGDDPTTLDIDEGAEVGDHIMFMINRVPLRRVSGEAVWTGDGNVVRVNLSY